MSSYVYSLLSILGINVMLAVSLNLISGLCGQFSLGHGAFYGAGAYAAALCATAGYPVPVALLQGSWSRVCSASLWALPRCVCVRISLPLPRSG